jgi:hypothetical protein
MKTIIFSCALLWSLPALADDASHDPNDADHAAETQGGTFSLLGRKCKADADAALETTPGSPPLDVDDPGTPGCNGWEINIVTSGEFGKGMDWETPLFDINYGVGDNIQLKFEIPYLVSQLAGVTTSGIGLAELGLKYRFYEDDSRDLSVAVYPQVEFAMPGTDVARGDEGGGTLTKLPVLLSTKVGETGKGNIMITANVGYNLSTQQATEHYVSAAFGVGFPLARNVAVMIEASTEQAFHKNMENVREGYVKANVGLFGPITDHLLWFAALGESRASYDTDDANHTCVVLGVRILAGGP